MVVREMYFAVLGDNVDSKNLSNRNEVMTHLRHVLNTVNYEYEEYIASNFNLTVRDEFHELLSNASKLFEILDFVWYSLYPIKLRSGIGIGDMSTSFRRETSNRSDGPAYWAARQAINTTDIKNSLICIEADLSKGLSNYALDSSVRQTLLDTIKNSHEPAHKLILLLNSFENTNTAMT